MAKDKYKLLFIILCLTANAHHFQVFVNFVWPSVPNPKLPDPWNGNKPSEPMVCFGLVRWIMKNANVYVEQLRCSKYIFQRKVHRMLKMFHNLRKYSYIDILNSWKNIFVFEGNNYNTPYVMKPCTDAKIFLKNELTYEHFRTSSYWVHCKSNWSEEYFP